MAAIPRNSTVGVEEVGEVGVEVQVEVGAGEGVDVEEPFQNSKL